MQMPAAPVGSKDELLKLIEANPGVEMEQVVALLEMIKEREKLGCPPAIRTPIPLVERRRVIVGESDESDPRTVRLGRRR